LRSSVRGWSGLGASARLRTPGGVRR
jgi:hypothetical protein